MAVLFRVSRKEVEEWLKASSQDEKASIRKNWPKLRLDYYAAIHLYVHSIVPIKVLLDELSVYDGISVPRHIEKMIVLWAAGLIRIKSDIGTSDVVIEE